MGECRMKEAKSGQKMKEETVFLEPVDVDAIEAELSYGDAKSAWIREAVRQRLDRLEPGDEEASE